MAFEDKTKLFSRLKGSGGAGEKKSFSQAKFKKNPNKIEIASLYFLPPPQYYLLHFKTSYNKGSQPANLEGNSAHVIGG